MANAVAVVDAQNVEKVFHRGPHEVRALDGLSLTVERGEFLSIVGPSGSGKTTLLQILGAIDVPTGGSVAIDGEDLADMGDERLTEFRRRRLGFVFQFFNLLPTMTAWENVALPHLLDGRSLRSVRQQSISLLDRVGLADRADHRPVELSGGEMQRVAIARALSVNPVLVLADEPTGNLDSEAGEQILHILEETVADGLHTVLMVTHDRAASRRGTRTIEMIDGRIVRDTDRS